MPIHDWTRVEAGIFHDFHHEWISETKRALNRGVLPESYYALAEQVAGEFGSDLLTLETVHSESPQSGETGPTTGDFTGGDGGVALMTAPPKVRFTTAVENKRHIRRRSRLAIRHGSDDNVVAVAEIVSAGNKSSTHALGAVVQKAIEFLDSGVHLLIVDLFPPGPRDPQGIHGAIWSELAEEESEKQFELPADKPLTLVAYAAGRVKRAFIEPVAVSDALPDMPLYLEANDYVGVPPESTYRAAFDAVPRRWRDVLETKT